MSRENVPVCDQMRIELLVEYVAGTLSRDQMQQVEQHVAVCEPCQAEISKLGSILSAVATSRENGERRRDAWPILALQIAKPDWLVARLKEAVCQRDVVGATQLAEGHRDRIADLDPSEPCAAELLSWFAQWIDMGFGPRGSDLGLSYLDLVTKALSKFSGTHRDLLRLLDCAHLEIVDGLLALRAEEYDRAISHFAFVISLNSRLGEKELVIVANYATASAECRKGAYKNALAYVKAAVAAAREANREEMAAACEVLRAWAMFQLDDCNGARKILRHAESVLELTTDHLSMGNIQAAFGRIAMRQRGEYALAIDHFNKALSQYKQCDVRHRNIARTLVNMAFAERLHALRLERMGDSKSPGHEAAIAQLRAQANKRLRKAYVLFDRQNSYRGRGNVLVKRAYLHIDVGALDVAADEAAMALVLASRKRDRILAIRARIVLCMLETAKAGGRVEDKSVLGFHADRARSHGIRAVELARELKHGRFLGKALTWLGIAYLSEYFCNFDEAIRCYNEARQLLGQNNDAQDHAHDDLSLLKTILDQHKGESSSIKRGGVLPFPVGQHKESRQRRVSKRPKIYLKREAYKLGWAHGFYNVVSDDGPCYQGASPLFFAPPEDCKTTEEAVRLYQEGQRAGVALRRSQTSRDPQDPFFWQRTSTPWHRE